MKRPLTIMMPLDNGLLSKRFGHCEVFLQMDVDVAQKTVVRTDRLFPPPHYPGLIPQWVMEEGADVVIAGGMGRRAQQIFASLGIKVIVGAPEYPPGTIVSMYLQGTLTTGPNPCEISGSEGNCESANHAIDRSMSS